MIWPTQALTGHTQWLLWLFLTLSNDWAGRQGSKQQEPSVHSGARLRSPGHHAIVGSEWCSLVPVPQSR